MIHFCANANGSPETIHALYELACRIGRPFAIHRTTGTVPDDGPVVVVGERPLSMAAVRPIVTLEPHSIGAIDLAGELANLTSSKSVFGVALSLLSFAHEDETRRDSMGRTPPTQNSLVAQGIAHIPWLERIAQEIWRRLLIAGCDDAPARTPWPQDRICLCLTHDVDGPSMFSLFSLARSAFLATVRGNRYERESLMMGLLFQREGLPDPYFNFDLWREYEALFSGRSTFFVYPGRLASAKWHPKDPKYDPRQPPIRDAIRSAVESGWEVGSHIGIHSHGRAPFVEARNRLNDTFGINVGGARGHYWSMNLRNPYRTWKDLREAGYEYDMTLSPMTLGFRGGFMLPISPSLRWGDNDPTSFLAIPTAVMDAYSVPRETGRTRTEIDRTLDHLLSAAQQHGGLLVLDWHERTFVNRGAWSGYLSSLVYVLTEAVARGGVTVISGREAADGWRQHVRALFRGIV